MSYFFYTTHTHTSVYFKVLPEQHLDPIHYTPLNSCRSIRRDALKRVHNIYVYNVCGRISPLCSYNTYIYIHHGYWRYNTQFRHLRKPSPIYLRFIGKYNDNILLHNDSRAPRHRTRTNTPTRLLCVSHIYM